jgi:hypothetical protein
VPRSLIIAVSRTSRSEAAVSPAAGGDIAIYFCRDPVDFRFSINGLSVMVEATLDFVKKRRNP